MLSGRSVWVSEVLKSGVRGVGQDGAKGKGKLRRTFRDLV
jgi:hypothetical protein